jgi:hypothetical protein
MGLKAHCAFSTLPREPVAQCSMGSAALHLEVDKARLSIERM